MSFAERLCLIFYISFGGSAKLLCLNIFFNVRMNQMTLSQNRTPQSVVRFAMVYFNDVYSKLKYINELIRCKKCLCGIKPQIASKIFIIFFGNLHTFYPNFIGSHLFFYTTFWKYAIFNLSDQFTFWICHQMKSRYADYKFKFHRGNWIQTKRKAVHGKFSWQVFDYVGSVSGNFRESASHFTSIFNNLKLFFVTTLSQIRPLADTFAFICET